MRPRASDERGMTLAELLVATAALALVGLAMWSLTALGFRANAKDEIDLFSLSGQRTAISRICRDVRAADSAAVSPDGLRLNLVVRGAPVSYFSDERGQLVRDEGGQTTVVAANAGALTFSLSAPAGRPVVSISSVSETGRRLTASVAVRRP